MLLLVFSFLLSVILVGALENVKTDVDYKLHLYTIGTRLNPLLFYLQHSGEVFNLPVVSRGTADPRLQMWSRKALQQKLLYHMDEAVRMKEKETLLMFSDAYDTLLEAGSKEILARYKEMKKKAPSCEVFFSSEEGCGLACIKGFLGAYGGDATGELGGWKITNHTENHAKYLCSGAFIGPASTLAYLFEKYPISKFAKEWPDQSEQYYWALVWGKEYAEYLATDKVYSPKLCLDDESKLFMSNIGYMESSAYNNQVLKEELISKPPEPMFGHPGLVFDFSKVPGKRVTNRRTSSNPVVLHWNGFWKTNLYRIYVELVYGTSTKYFYENLNNVEKMLDPLGLGNNVVFGGARGLVEASRLVEAIKGPEDENAITGPEDEKAFTGPEDEKARQTTEGRMPISVVSRLLLQSSIPENQNEEMISRTRRQFQNTNEDDFKVITRRKLEAYGGITDATASVRAAVSAHKPPLHEKISLDELSGPSFYRDWDVDLPSYIFLGGQLTYVLAVELQIAYYALLALMGMRFYLSIKWRIYCKSEGLSISTGIKKSSQLRPDFNRSQLQGFNRPARRMKTIVGKIGNEIGNKVTNRITEMVGVSGYEVVETTSSSRKTEESIEEETNNIIQKKHSVGNPFTDSDTPKGLIFEKRDHGNGRNEIPTSVGTSTGTINKHVGTIRSTNNHLTREHQQASTDASSSNHLIKNLEEDFFIPISTQISHSLGGKTKFQIFRIVFILLFIIFLTAHFRLVYLLSYHLLESIKLQAFCSIPKSVYRTLGNGFSWWMNRGPVIYPIIGTVIITQNFLSYTWKFLF